MPHDGRWIVAACLHTSASDDLQSVGCAGDFHRCWPAFVASGPPHRCPAALVLPVVLLPFFMEGRSLSVGAFSLLALPVGAGYLLPLSMVLLLTVFLLFRPDVSDSNLDDASGALVLSSMFLGLVPSVVLTYFVNDIVIAASLTMSLVLGFAAFVCSLARKCLAHSEGKAPGCDALDTDLFSPPLSPREMQFVRLLLAGKAPAEIARETGTKASTVRTTLHRAYGKASVGGARELVALLEHGRTSTRSQRETTERPVLSREGCPQTRLWLVLAVFLVALAFGPLAIATSDWGSGTPWMVALSLAAYFLGIALALIGNSSHGKLLVGVGIVLPAGDEGPLAWAPLSALELSFAYVVAWRCARDVFLGTPIFLCGIALAAPLAVGVHRMGRRIRRGTVFLAAGTMVLLGLIALLRARIPAFSVLMGISLIFMLLQDRRYVATLAAWMTCFGLLLPFWIAVLNGVQDLTVFESQMLSSAFGSSSAVDIIVATVVVCCSALMCGTHILLVRSLEDEEAVAAYRVGRPDSSVRDRRFALLKSRALSNVQAEILLKTAEGATTKEIASTVGYAASTVQALRSASYRQLGIKGKVELVSLLSQVDGL